MSKLLRYFTPGSTYFIASVTYHKIPLLAKNEKLLIESIKETKKSNSFNISAWVILPDHFHMIITPEEDNLDKIMRKIKLRFSYKYRHKYGLYRGTVWQKRYWDHIIRNQEDMNRHIDYIHYNPVKHEYSNNPFLWKYSSIDSYLKAGIYSNDWGVDEADFRNLDFGE